MVPATLYAERGFQTLLSADVDGVSGDELLKINATVQSGKDRLTVKVYKPGLGLSLTQTSTFTFDSEAPNSSSIWPKVYLPGDYNGDGKAELLAISMDRPLDKDMNSKCYLFDLSTNKVLFNAHVFNFNVKQGILVAVDIDGDGKTDICHINFGITRVYSFSQVNGVYSLNLKCSFDLSYNYVFQSNRDMAIGDINGDGKPEFLVTPVKSYTKKVRMRCLLLHTNFARSVMQNIRKIMNVCIVENILGIPTGAWFVVSGWMVVVVLYMGMSVKWNIGVNFIMVRGGRFITRYPIYVDRLI